MPRGLPIVAVLLCLAGCSGGEDVSIAERGIADFHQRLDTGQFGAIYAGSSQDMKSATNQASLVQLLAAVHRKLGAFKAGKSAGWNDTVSTGGHFVTLNYAATYERGMAQENFVYRIADGKALLAGYHINSRALLLN
jgi:hypothetical protein